MIKLKVKCYFVICLILITLVVGAYYILQQNINKVWIKGVYPLDNDIVIYHDNLSSNVQIGTIIVGEDVYESINSGGKAAEFVSENNTFEAEYAVIAALKHRHYYVVEFLLTAPLPVGEYTFSEIMIKNADGESIVIAEGNIKVMVNRQHTTPGVEGLVFGSRTSDSIDFMYVINNTTSENLFVTHMTGNLNTKKDSHQLILSIDELQSSVTHMGDGEPFTFPVIVPPKKKVSFIYSYPLISHSDESRYFFLMPEFSYSLDNDKTIRKLFMKDVATAPFPYINKDKVLSIIEQKR